MADFIVRIEVHNSDSFDYEALHDALEEREFFRIMEVNGETLQLPQGTYLAKFNSSPEAVRQIAQGAVESLGWNAGILVAKLGDLDTVLAFSGLVPYEEA